MSSDVIRQPLLSIEEAAAYLNVPVRWVADAARERKDPLHPASASTSGSALEHLDELIDAGEQPVTTPVTRPIRRIAADQH